MKKLCRKRFPGSRLLSFALSLALALSFFPVFGGVNAKADKTEYNETLQELGKNAIIGYEAYDFLDENSKKKAFKSLEEKEQLPESYDLRNVDTDEDGVGDTSYVTPVKFQNPFGTCWGFSAISAAETSLLSSGLAEADGYTADTLDLSEKHLAYFITVPVDDPKDSQYDEGYHYRDGLTTQNKLSLGAFMFEATTLFASGVGPNLEDRDYPESSGKQGSMEDVLGYHGKKRMVENKNISVMKNGEKTGETKWIKSNYSAKDDWDIDHSYRYYQSYKLKESNMLPSPAGRTEDDKYEYNPTAVEMIKDEIYDGKAVSVAYCSDASLPDQKSDGKYISRNWAHYTYESAGTSHAVTIVGWDDNYPKENFAEKHQPPGNGAWLVKNSWGSDEQTFPNNGYTHWGMLKTDDQGNPVKDADGNDIHTGYFWLSYYDQSITACESFEFDRSNVGTSYKLEQYDKMPQEKPYATNSEKELKTANIFHAEEAAVLEQVSCQTTHPGTEVTYNVYLLADSHSSPADGILVDTMTETYEYGGFHKKSLNTPVKIQEGQYYSVEVVQKVDGKYPINLKIGYNKNYADEEERAAWVKGVINKGESFIGIDGVYEDLSNKDIQMTLLGDDYEDSSIDNFPIKAYLTDKTEGGDPLDDLSVTVKNNSTIELEDDTDHYLLARIEGSSDFTPKNIEWKNSNPTIADITPDEKNDAICYVKGKLAGIAYVSATMDGIGTCVCKIYVAPPPNEIKSLQVGEPDSGELTLEFTDHGKYGIDGYDVCVRIEGESDWSKPISVKQPADKALSMITLTGLEPGKKYEVRLRSFVVVGDEKISGAWSEDEVSEVLPFTPGGNKDKDKDKDKGKDTDKNKGKDTDKNKGNVTPAPVNKAANTLKVKGKTVTIKYDKVMKKKRTIKKSKAYKISKAQGKVTFKLGSVNKKKFKKKFKVNKKTGTITVKKGIKKGTYKVKVKIKAAGNAKYKASKQKTATVKIIIN